MDYVSIREEYLEQITTKLAIDHVSRVKLILIYSANGVCVLFPCPLGDGDESPTET